MGADWVLLRVVTVHGPLIWARKKGIPYPLYTLYNPRAHTSELFEEGQGSYVRAHETTLRVLGCVLLATTASLWLALSRE